MSILLPRVNLLQMFYCGTESEMVNQRGTYPDVDDETFHEAVRLAPSDPEKLALLYTTVNSPPVDSSSLMLKPVRLSARYGRRIRSTSRAFNSRSDNDY